MQRKSSRAEKSGATERRLAVSTECPTCAAPLDFSEGSNAIQCQHCRSNLLVTGRGRILSYAISPRASLEKARDAVRLLVRVQSSRVSSPSLFFVPFYRVTGHEFSWRRPAPEPKMIRSLSEGTGDTSRELEWGQLGGTNWQATNLADVVIEAATLLFERLTRAKERTGDRQMKRSRAVSPPPALPPRFTPAPPEPLEFGHRHIEKNFVAGESEGLGIYSLGVRSSVLRLELFDAAKLGDLGRLLPVDLEPAAALERGLMGGDDSIVVRQTAGVVVSLIYFPFWIARIESANGTRVVALDGVTGSVASPDIPPAMFEHTGAVPDVPSTVAGFRPLVCPNCGWNLPVSADEAIFFCGTCMRAWEIEGNELRPIAHEIASIDTMPRVSPNDLYLPFWIAEASEPDGHRKIFVPAFRYRQLRHLEMLGTRLSKMQPKFTTISEPLCPVHGAHYDEADGLALARFLHAGLVPEKGGSVEPPVIENPRLLWVPFARRGNSLFDPFTGSNLFANLLH